ncbi:helix-turn-helix transcriptional regulator, partial [Streptomyces olindensis]
VRAVALLREDELRPVVGLVSDLAGCDRQFHPVAAPVVRDALEGLASMERQVASLVMEGATNREIAARLFISVKTVEATLTRVYRKLGIRSRVDIVRLAAGRRTT